jgi:integrase
MVSGMLVGMGLIRNEHGVWCARVRVEKDLREAVARVLDVSKESQTFLQKSLRTKDKAEAKRRLPAVLMQFNETLRKAEALMASEANLPLRTALAQSEIDRIAEFHFASKLAADDEATHDSAGEEDFTRSIAKQLDDAGIEYDTPFPFDVQRPAYGLTDRQVLARNNELLWLLSIMRPALSRGDISVVSEPVGELLDRFHINLDRSSEAYRKLGLAVLRADVRASEALVARYCGEPVETPPISHLEPNEEAPPSGDTLSAALEGWKKATRPSAGTLAEYERAVGLFVQLHGDMPVVAIKKRHARSFCGALQDVPRIRSKELQALPLPQLATYGREHAEVPKVTEKTVNKQLGGVQAIANWAANKGGLIPDDVDYVDAFARMRLEEDEPEREPFTPAELRTIFSSPVYTEGAHPEGGKGEAAFWLPLLAAFTGARLGDYAGLSVADILTDEDANVPVMVLRENTRQGRTLKTKSTARTIPLHPELIRIGFLRFVDSRRAEGAGAWLFPLIAPGTNGAAAFSKWWGRYLGSLGITDERKVFHSFRHNAKDALRKAKVQEDLNDAITGHAGGGVGRGYGTKDILARYGTAQVAEAVASIRYPNLDLHGICWPSDG